ncbi:hypothetical protein [Humidisolicoccus flavus]|uniref:hypothetical protein n=1 Tax=Humidisolicoccus flavus TaxID=3111414 RepID=UPI00324321E2
MTSMKKFLLSALAFGALIGTAGCASSQQEPASETPEPAEIRQSDVTYADLDIAPTDSKPLPSALPADSLEEADRDSARWVGEFKGIDLWLMEGTGEVTVCLLAFPEDGAWFAGCGWESVAMNAGGGPTFEVIHDDGAVPENLNAISANVFTTAPLE